MSLVRRHPVIPLLLISAFSSHWRAGRVHRYATNGRPIRHENLCGPRPEAPPRSLAERGVARVPRRLRAARCNISTAFDIQLVVITAAEEPANWPQLQSELAALSSNSVHKLVAGTSDASLLFTERDAAPSSVAIAEVLSSVRTGRPLYP